MEINDINYHRDKFEIGNGSLTLIAGPCSLESLELGLEVARTMKALCEERGISYIFKASFDKANRTSIHSWRGPGLEKGMKQLQKIKEDTGIPVLTDIHESCQAEPVGRVVDVIQIPAFLCRQTDLLTAAAATGKLLNIKKAQFLAPEDMAHVLAKCKEAGNTQVMLCERGTMMGYRRLVVDMTGLVTMRSFGCPVVFDATHSVQRPGGLGGTSGGDRAMALPLAKAAAAVGIDVLFVETHPDPDQAKSDGPNMIALSDMGNFLDQVLAIHRTSGLKPLPENKFLTLKRGDSTKLNNILPCERTGQNCTDEALLETGQELIRTEANELLKAANRVDLELVHAARAIYECRGRVVVVGMGKSGHIARKIAATLASLGTPAFFLHAAEGAHGDLGMVRREDVGLFISNSGTTSEVLGVLPYFHRLGAMKIAITGGSDSPLARHSDIVIDSGVKQEGTPLQLAPMSSTTLQLVIGDALASMVTQLRGLKREDFALFHPGGALGRRLLTMVCDVMGTPEQLPTVEEHVLVREALFSITSKNYGATCVLDEQGLLVGIFTDGDLRRLMESRGVEALNLKIADVMTQNPKTIGPDSLAAEAVSLMEKAEISVLVVVEDGRPVGMVHIHELLKAGLM